MRFCEANRAGMEAGRDFLLGSFRFLGKPTGQDGCLGRGVGWEVKGQPFCGEKLFDMASTVNRRERGEEEEDNVALSTQTKLTDG